MTEEQEHTVAQLVATLADKDTAKRIRGREALVKIGSAAVPGLLTALGDSQKHVRWEAAKTLTEIADPAAAESLAAALDDEDTDVRWVASEAMIALKRDAIKPLLHGLTTSQDSTGLYKSAHHVLRELSHISDLGPLLAPVLQALDAPEPAVAVPVAALSALENVV